MEQDHFAVEPSPGAMEQSHFFYGATSFFAELWSKAILRGRAAIYGARSFCWRVRIDLDPVEVSPVLDVEADSNRDVNHNLEKVTVC